MKNASKLCMLAVLMMINLYANVVFAANECRAEYEDNANVKSTVDVNAGQEKSIDKEDILWIQNKKDHEIKVEVTKMVPAFTGFQASGTKWVTLPNKNDIDPPTAPTFPYPPSVTFYKISCPSTQPDTQSGTIQIGGGAITTVPLQPKIRALTKSERSVARSVFGNSINLNMVKVTNTVGLESRPWTTNTPPVYTINVGVDAYKNLASETWDDLLIHELSHVWQGQHLIPFMANSAVHQTLARIQSGNSSGAYKHTPGKQWSKSNREQQASIVERWFRRGRKTFDELYPYIRDNVRPGRPNDPTKFNVPMIFRK